MNTNQRIGYRAILLFAAMILIAAASSRLQAATGTCSGQSISLPFTDVPASNPFFCVIAAAFFSGLTNGTTATTYSPSANVPREQIAAFVTRTLDQSLTRSSQRAALDQWWMPRSFNDLQQTTVGNAPQLLKSDGVDVWVPNIGSNTVSRVNTVSGQVTGTWTGASQPESVLIARGQVFVLSFEGTLYSIDPGAAPSSVNTVVNGLGLGCLGIAFDGSRIWTTTDAGSVSAITLNPVSVQTFSTGLVRPFGILFDGTHIWVTDQGDDTLKKLNSDGSVALTVTLPNIQGNPEIPVFDGTNIWVPAPSKLFVVRAIGPATGPTASGTVLATLTGNGLGGPIAASFDGQRVLVANTGLGGNLSLWKASDLTPLGFFPVGSGLGAQGVCSDGLNFWIALQASVGSPGKVVRF